MHNLDTYGSIMGFWVQGYTENLNKNKKTVFLVPPLTIRLGLPGILQHKHDKEPKGIMLGMLQASIINFRASTPKPSTLNPQP